jgi:GYF domain 2
MQDFPIKTIIETRDTSRILLNGTARALSTEEEAKAQEKLLASEKAAEEAKAEQQARLIAEARAAEEAAIRKAARERSDQVGRFHAAAAARVAEEAKIAAVAEIRAKTDEEARIQAEIRAKQQAEQEANAAQEARLRAEAEAQAQAQANAKSEAAAKVAEESSQMLPPEKMAQRMSVGAARRKAVKKIYKKSKRPKGGNKKVWFYTCEGERLGPIAFKQLRELATDSSLNPRLDMIWREGMEMWKPAGEVDGLFERRNVRVSSQGAVAAPFHRPLVRSSRSVVGKNASWPGARRPSFLFASVFFPFVWHYSLKAAGPTLTKEFGQMIMGGIFPFMSAVPVFLVIHLGLQRLVNLGMSRWWIFAAFGPVLNFWLGYRCLACPPGYAYHRKLDSAGVVLAILYGSALMLAGLAVVAGIALLFEPASSSTQWKPLREAVRSAIQLFK